MKNEIIEELENYITSRIKSIEEERHHDYITQNEEGWRVHELQMMQDFIETDIKQ